MLSIPKLLGALGQCDVSSPQLVPLLASGQAGLCDLFTAWPSRLKRNAVGATVLTAGHGPALLGFAAVVTLLKDMPGVSGQSHRTLSMHDMVVEQAQHMALGHDMCHASAVCISAKLGEANCLIACCANTLRDSHAKASWQPALVKMLHCNNKHGDTI